jgi:hypothetical protein
MSNGPPRFGKSNKRLASDDDAEPLQLDLFGEPTPLPVTARELHQLYKESANSLHVWDAIRQHDENKVLDWWIWEYLICTAHGLLGIAEKDGETSTPKVSGQKPFDDALAVLGLKEEDFNF